MKTKLFLAFTIAGAMTLTSCTQKPDEKTMADINQFGTDWTSLGEKATAWSAELTTSAQQAKDCATKGKEMCAKCESSKDHTMKTACTSMCKAADEDAAKIDAITTEWTAFKATWDENTKAFSEWKDKVTSGTISNEEATNGLIDWKTKIANASTTIDTWTTSLTATKESYMHNMTACDEMEKSMSSITSPKSSK